MTLKYETDMKYGGDYVLKNGYRLKTGWDDSKGGDLDANPENDDVYTTNCNEPFDYYREGLTSVWYIESATDPDKKDEPVLTNDVMYIYLVSGGGRRYLATAGRGCNDNLLCVSLPPGNIRRRGGGGYGSTIATRPSRSGTGSASTCRAAGTTGAGDTWAPAATPRATTSRANFLGCFPSPRTRVGMAGTTGPPCGARPLGPGREIVSLIGRSSLVRFEQ